MHARVSSSDEICFSRMALACSVAEAKISSIAESCSGRECTLWPRKSTSHSRTEGPRLGVRRLDPAFEPQSIGGPKDRWRETTPLAATSRGRRSMNNRSSPSLAVLIGSARSRIRLKGKAPAPNPIFLDNDDGTGEFLGGDGFECPTKACDRFCLAVIATPEKDQSGTLALG